MPKSPDAFRTISEVADWLGVQAHVLRFWESKFTQVKPIKRAGGRRYYRPADMLLIGGIKKLLHDDGLTIKGAQKLLREKGIAHVADLSQPLDDLTIAVIEGSAEEIETVVNTPLPTDGSEGRTLPDAAAAGLEAETTDETVGSAENVDAPPDTPLADPPADPTEEPEPAAVDEVLDVPASASQDPDLTPVEETAELTPNEESVPVSADADLPEPEASIGPEDEPPAVTDAEDAEEVTEVMPTFRARNRAPIDPSADTPQQVETTTPETAADTSADGPDDTNGADSEDEGPFKVSPPAAPADEAPKPRVIDVGPLPDLADFPAEPSALSAVSRLTKLDAEQAQAIKPLLARLTRLRASMSSPRKDIGKD